MRKRGFASVPTLQSAEDSSNEVHPDEESQLEIKPQEDSPHHVSRYERLRDEELQHNHFRYSSRSHKVSVHGPEKKASVPHFDTLYDELQDVWHGNPFINSTFLCASLIAHLEHRHPTSDGRFTVCIGSGSYNFIGKKLYQSIPAENRPKIESTERYVSYVIGGSQRALGTISVPLLFENLDGDTTKWFRICLNAFILEDLKVGMFVSHPRWITEMASQENDWVYTCDFGNGKNGRIPGEPFPSLTAVASLSKGQPCTGVEGEMGTLNMRDVD